ncbi:MAG: hypothetical protein R3B45_06435 [Bdellovibrionota bacterium]
MFFDIYKSYTRKILQAIAVFTLFIACGKSKPKGTDANLTRTELEKAADVSLSDFYWDNVELEFIKPGVDELKNTASAVPVEISVKGAPLGTTWSLYYNQYYLSPEGGIAIAKDQSIEDTSVTWQTEALTRGTYYLFIILKYKTAQNIRYYGSGIAIEQEGAENRTPFVSITPLSNNPIAYKPGDAIDIRFLSVDPDGSPLTFDIRYSNNDGNTWNSIQTAIKSDSEILTYDEDTGQYTYTWTIADSLPQGPYYQLEVLASDGESKGTGKLNNNFGVTPVDITYFDQIRPILNAKCAYSGCHSGDTPARDLKLDYFDNTQFVSSFYAGFNNRRDRILQRTGKDADQAIKMPPTGNPDLTDSERALIQLWFYNQGINGNRRLPGGERPGNPDNTILGPLADSVVNLNASTSTNTDVPVSWNITQPTGDTTTFEVVWAPGPDFNVWTVIPGSASPINWSINGDQLGLASGGSLNVRIRVIATTNKGRQNSATNEFTIAQP